MEGENSFSGARLVEGKLVIPESKRKDGSVRQKIQVRPGYVAPEDTPRYRPGGGGLAFLEKQMRKLKLENESQADKRKQQENETKPTKSMDEKEKKSTENVEGTMKTTGKEYMKATKERILPRATETTDKKEMRNLKQTPLKKSSRNATPEWRRSARPFHQENFEKPPKPKAAGNPPRTLKGKWKQRNEDYSSESESGSRLTGKE
ncbi:mago binding protein [Schizosaccharomyces osmophilus]|uniref:Mago binding protein n=1 Tax=Schizosaccharomyces osmophilus TaxID=2545709 RepID=A0AAF0AW60_9SCHI|nr:mago binding protein [Schizosaccharomyces osmophilus]WBW73158.1 mago binding protein [Schizosaccharomyces osmophilus]